MQRAAPAKSLPAIVLAASLGGCALAPDNLASVFIDPGKYDIYSCPQLAAHLQVVSKREQDLRGLIDKAEQSTGGAVAGALAYRTDYLNARGELALVQEVMQRKDCAREVKTSR